MNIRQSRLTQTGRTDGLAGYYEVEIYGLLSKLEGHDYAVAHFGTFKRGNRVMEYSATVWADNGEVFHDYDSEFCDDLQALLLGNVQFLD